MASSHHRELLSPIITIDSCPDDGPMLPDIPRAGSPLVSSPSQLSYSQRPRARSFGGLDRAKARTGTTAKPASPLTAELPTKNNNKVPWEQSLRSPEIRRRTASPVPSPRDRASSWGMMDAENQSRVLRIASRLRGEMTFMRAVGIVEQLHAEDVKLQKLRSQHKHDKQHEETKRKAKPRQVKHVGFSESVDSGSSSPGFVETLSTEAQIALLMEYKELLQQAIDNGRIELENQAQVEAFLADDDWGAAGDPRRHYKLAQQYEHAITLLDEVKRKMGQEVTHPSSTRKLKV